MLHIVIRRKMEFKCIAKNSRSHMKEAAPLLRGTNREVQRCAKGNGVLSFKAQRVVRPRHAFSFSLSRSFSFALGRVQMPRVEERCTVHAASFYTKDSVTTRFPP